MRHLLSIGVFVATMTGSPAHAEDLNGVWFAGGTLNDSQSGYAGAVVALPGGRLGEGLAIRASANAGNYDYFKGSQQIDGAYVGGEIALVYQTSGRWGWANFSIGPRLTDTWLKPTDSENKRTGTRLDVGLQTDGALDGPRWRLSWLGSIAPVNEFYLARLQLGRKFGAGKYRVGLESGVIGDPTFAQWSAGPFLALPFVGRSELQLGSGAILQQGKSARAYASIGLSSVF
jgi:hypothetical protein